MTLPLFPESVGSALIDSARISAMAAMLAFPPPPESRIVPSDAEQEVEATVFDCLALAMVWLDAARVMTVQKGAPATSLHVVDAAGRPK